MSRWEIRMFFINIFPMRRHNKSNDHENNNKFRQRSKKGINARGKFRRHLHQILSNENCIYDPLVVLTKPMGTISTRTMR